MPGALKISRNASTHLFKYISRVEVKFNPFDSRTRSARELLRQVQAERFVKANPKLKIMTNVVATADPPMVKFEFVDGTQRTYDSQQYVAKEMMEDILLAANAIDIGYELEGKSVDDK